MLDHLRFGHFLQAVAPLYFLQHFPHFLGHSTNLRVRNSSAYVYDGSHPHVLSQTVRSVVPVPQHGDILRREIVECTHEIRMDRIRQPVGHPSLCQHVKIPGEVITAVAVEAMDEIGQRRAALDLFVA